MAPSAMQCCILQSNTMYMDIQSDTKCTQARWNTMEYESRVLTNVLGMNRQHLDERQNYKLFEVYDVILLDSLIRCSEKLVSRKLVYLNYDKVHGIRFSAFACPRCIT